MTETEVIDGTAQEIGHDVAVVHHPPATLFRTDDPVEVVEKASRVADALKDVIVKKNLFTMIQGKAHVNVEGWQLVGAMLGVTAVCVHTEPVDGGYLATVEARTADGRVIGSADAVCTKHERRGPWKNADDYARLSMAQTRATSKALKGPLGFVVSLAGYATTPAEEMTFAQPDPPPAAKDVKQTGVSDVPTDDPWFAEVKPTLAGVPSAGLRAAVVAAGGTVPDKVSSWEKTICALKGTQRGRFVAALDELRGVDPVPWDEPAATEAVA